MSRQLRIAVVLFMHETVTMLPNDTTLQDFIYEGSPAGGDALLAAYPRDYMGGFVQFIREHQDVTLVGIESPLFPKTGTGSGWVTAEAFDTFTDRMVELLVADGPFDGVYLCLHGAMAVRGTPRPEAELARRVRAAVGPKAMIVATFDPHGNEDAAFFEHADMAFTGKYFPHYDMHLQGERAARYLLRALRGDYRPTNAVIRVPILSPTVVQWTGASPWSDLIQRALVWEARSPGTIVNVFFGFPWADVPDAGMTIAVVTNDDPALAHGVARDMAEFAWRRREALLSAARVHSMAEGVALAQQAVSRGETPVVLADHSDRSGAATWLLQEVVAQRLEHVLIATVMDHDTVRSVLSSGAKEGDAFDGDVGGRVAESAGQPVRITGRIERIVRDAGRDWICVRFGVGNLVVISPYLVQVMEPSALAVLGLDLAQFAVIALKSRVHFRRGFDDSGFARTILLVEPAEPFLGTVRLDALPYENLDPRSYFPWGDASFGDLGDESA